MTESFSRQIEQGDLRPKHLKEGIKPIMVCLGTARQFESQTGPEAVLLEPYTPDRVTDALDVDIFLPPERLREQNLKSPERMSYAISPIDSRDKFSESFADCTGLVVAGKDKETGENISFLTHQFPDYFLESEENKQTFLGDLKERLEEMRSRCEEGTIDAGIIGGNYLKDSPKSGSKESHRKAYLASIKLLSSAVSETLGFNPLPMSGPNLLIEAGPDAKDGADDVFYDNENRRLYLVRPEVGDSGSEPFSPEDIEKQEEKWRKDLKI